MHISNIPVQKWQAYRELRLRALKEDAQAFGSSYADSLGQPEAFWKGRLAEAADGKRSWLLFATQETELVGMIGAFLEQEPTDTATIVSVYVPREARGRGIGSQLMEAMLRVLSALPTLTTAQLSVNVTQLAAIDLYRRFGFRGVGVEPSITGAGEPAQQLIMQRELPVRDLE